MKITQHFLTKNDCYKSGRKIVPKGIMVHSLGVPQPDVNVFLKNWNVSGLQVCVHAFVTPDGVYQTLPWNARGWHCAGDGNNTHISFEICEPSGFKYDGGATMIGYDAAAKAKYFRAVWNNSVELCAFLCKEYGLTEQDIICHSEGFERGIASNHADVMHWFPKHGESMDTFRAAVNSALFKQEEDDDMVRYDKLQDITNPDFRTIVDKLMTVGIIGGDGSDPTGNNDVIDLSHDQVRTLVFTYRGGGFDKKLLEKGLDPAVK